ncbi:MAG: AAA family ATPase [Anaerolineales bacterium]
MIPEALHLRNFLSHVSTDLDLRGVHLACLVGANGAGKSSLLDAITWVAWGRSRASYGHDEDLIYHGERELEVEYVFRMPYQGGQERRFRILRRRELRGRRSTTSVLDFQIQGDGGWRSLNGNTMRETQNRISEYIGLDYDTFVNSAYLRQGHADEFTVQTPTERKRVLSAILGLERWDEYLDRVKQRLAETQGELDGLDRRLEEIEAELARRAAYQATLKSAEDESAAAALALEKIQARVNDLTRLQEQARSIQRQIEDFERRVGEEEERLAALQREEVEHRQRRDDYRARIGAAEEIETRYRAYQQALQEERSWGEKLGQAARLQEEKAKWERTIAGAAEALRETLRKREQGAQRLERALDGLRAQIEQQVGDLQGRIQTLQERLLGKERSAELEEVEGRLAYLGQMEEVLEQARSDLQENSVERSRLRERNRQLKALMDDTKKNLDDLAESEASCPLCRQPLSPEHHERLLEEIESEGRAMGDEFRANQLRLRDLQELDGSLTGQIREQERLLLERPIVEAKIARLRQQQEQAEEASERITALQEEVAALQERLAQETYGAEERAQLIQLRKELVALQAQLERQDFAADARAALDVVLEELRELGYDAAAHEALKARVRALAPAEADYRELEKARVGVQGEIEALKRVALEVTAQETRISQLARQQEEQEEALEALQPRLAEAAELARSLQAARTREAEARHRVGAARQTLAALDTQERRLKRFREERKGLADKITLYGDLKEAFGVNGIPAMIIEHTLPELEREANRILEQLTNGRMHVRFETQKETKAGDVRETLDIIISDEQGTRPYENFSGGEQFRVNFAIRVALSRLLARRAGVQLRSLFVDEGFGTLDADGRRRLVEAVKAVQDDFNLILVITHIEELQDAFPVRIQVTKNDLGSQVAVI